MQRNIAKLTIANEMDLVLAYKRTMQLSERCGIALPNQTKFATAVSEICRNVIEYVGEGTIQFNIVTEDGLLFLEAYIADRGRGIGNLDYYLEPKVNFSGRGTGIANARKLADAFFIETEWEKGTRVKLRKRIPANHPLISKAIIDSWLEDFARDTVSPYEEIKTQNVQLIQLLEELRLKNLETESQLQEIKRLNLELLSSHDDISNLLTQNEANNRLLQQKNKELDSFAHIVSHDLRAPLQNIKGLTMAIESYLSADEAEAIPAVLKMLNDQAGRMDNLILDILSYSLAGKKNLTKKDIRLQELLYEVVSFLNIPNGFRIEIPENMPALHTEEIFLRQVFNNLINNAIKHHDRETGVINIYCFPENGFLKCIVADDGPGIHAADQLRIFNQFETVNDAPLSASTGLGLTIIKKITREKGGNVWVESDGRGSRFIFTWPGNEIIS